jgi:hypothetical protein
MPLQVPKSRDPATLADWAELLVLSTEGNSVSTTRLGQLLKGDGGEQAEEEMAYEQQLDEDSVLMSDVELALIDEGRGEREMHLEQLLDEISLRLELGPKIYPFEHEDQRVVRRTTSGEQVYLFLLALSWEDLPGRRERRLHEVEAAYDMLALEALRRYLGRGARGIRFARNAHDPNDNATRPKKFQDAIMWLRKELKLGVGISVPPDSEEEEHWENEDAPAGRAPLNSYSDAGVDIVVWWRFADERTGSPVLLAQCTVQLEWGEKVKDISVELWKKWIDFATVPPQTALVIPLAVNRAYAQWDDRTVTAGVIIDRLRLMELLNELEEDGLESLVDQETREWVDKELAAAA